MPAGRPGEDSWSGNRSQRPADRDSFARTPLSYDFRRPLRVHKDQLRGIENLHGPFARQVSASLAHAMRMVVDVDMAFVDQVLYSEWILMLDNPCCAYCLTVKPPGGNAMLNISNDLVMALVDRAFGGKGTALTADPRPLTTIETNVINQVATRICRDFANAWEAIIPLRVTDIVLETNPELVQGADSGDLVLLVAFEVSAPHCSGLLHLVYPMADFEPLLGQLSPQAMARKRQKRETSRRPSPTIDKLQVPVSAQIARGNLPLRDLASLRIGDVIRLDTHPEEPAIIFLGGQPKFLAQVGLDGQRRAARIIAPIEPGDEEAYR